MRGALLRYHDANRKMVAELTKPYAAHFAKRHSLDFVEVEIAGAYDDPYFLKPALVLEELQRHEFVVYADTDVLFVNADPVATWCLHHPFLVSTDNAGICNGFFVVQRTDATRRLLRVWRDLGPMNTGRCEDQDTLKHIFANFEWAESLLETVPPNVVSNPEVGEIGHMAHHFWTRMDGDEKCAERIKAAIATGRYHNA